MLTRTSFKFSFVLEKFFIRLLTSVDSSATDFMIEDKSAELFPLKDLVLSISFGLLPGVMYNCLPPISSSIAISIL